MALGLATCMMEASAHPAAAHAAVWRDGLVGRGAGGVHIGRPEARAGTGTTDLVLPGNMRTAALTSGTGDGVEAPSRYPSSNPHLQPTPIRSASILLLPLLPYPSPTSSLLPPSSSSTSAHHPTPSSSSSPAPPSSYCTSFPPPAPPPPSAPPQHANWLSSR